MSKKDVYILMYKDYEVLSFYVDFRTSRTNFLAKLQYFDKAPYGFNEDDKKINTKLYRFFDDKKIPSQRKGYKEILKATHCKNTFNLIFKVHGLSLSNHYWFKKPKENLKYDDINFFTNKWDDTFARKLINEDYEGLGDVNLNVPDLMTAGWGVKGWIYDEKKGPRLYKIGIHSECPDEVLGEVLASRLAKRLLNNDEVLEHDLEKINGKYASISSPMIGLNEDLFPLSAYLTKEQSGMYRNSKFNKTLIKPFFESLKTDSQLKLYDFFIKIACLKTLCFVNDLHFENISIIKNTKTGTLKIAPLYDLGGSFGSSAHAKAYLEKPCKTTLLLIYFFYGDLDPEWDYSWYDSSKLVGFEDEITSILSLSNFYKKDILDFIIAIYQQQKKFLDELANKKKK